MQNNLILFILVIVSGAASFLGAPWWAIAPLSGLAAFFFLTSPGRAYTSAFSAGFLLWCAAAMMSNLPNGGALAGKVGQIFQGFKSWHLLIITGILGGLLAGFGALCGVYFRTLFTSSKSRRYRGQQLKV